MNRTCYLLLLHDMESGKTGLGMYSERHPTMRFSVAQGLLAETHGEDYGEACRKMREMLLSEYPYGKHLKEFATAELLLKEEK
jgi:hypothetical protein